MKERVGARLAEVERGTWLAGGALAMAFVASRLGAHLAGVRYDAALLPVALQHLDVDQLRDRLLESLWYQHSQPPLFNLLIGLVYKFSPLSPERTFHLLWLVLGAVLVVVVFTLLRDLGVPRWAAVVATVVITCSPTVLLYENWASYEYPLAVAITAIALAALRYARSGAWSWLIALVVLAGGCVLTRALLNPLWYVGLIALVLVARRPPRWLPALAVVAVPLVLVAGLMVKNQVLFGSFSTSSWLGWNLQRVTIDELPQGDRDQLIADGTLSPMAAYAVFLPIEKYDGVTPPCTPAHPDVPVLADPVKHNGPGNFNNECYVPITNEALRNAVKAARARPGGTARAIVGSFQIWGESASQYAFVYDNRLKIDGYDTAYRQLVLLDLPWDPPVKTNAGWWIPIGTPGGRWRISLTVVLASLAAVVVGVRGGWRVLRRRADPVDVALAAIGFTVLTVTIVGNVFEIGENNRFRFIVEPITFVVAAWLLTRAWQLGRARWAPRSTADDAVDVADRPDPGAVHP